METRPDSDTLTCASCGKDVEVSARFCGFCGVKVDDQPPLVQSVHSLPFPVRLADASYLIPTQRILLMTLVSQGMYLFYWFYLTWKQYKVHTGAEAYPVWHALCLLVPIYRLFVVHAHMRSFKQLMTDANVPSSINVGGSVLMVFAVVVLNLVGLFLSGAITGEVPFAGWPPVGTIALSVIAIAITVAMLVHVQGNLNHYWETLNGGPLPPTRIGSGEVVFAILGVVSWLLTAATLAGIIDPASPPAIQ